MVAGRNMFKQGHTGNVRSPVTMTIGVGMDIAIGISEESCCHEIWVWLF